MTRSSFLKTLALAPLAAALGVKAKAKPARKPLPPLFYTVDTFTFIPADTRDLDALCDKMRRDIADGMGAPRHVLVPTKLTPDQQMVNLMAKIHVESLDGLVKIYRSDFIKS